MVIMVEVVVDGSNKVVVMWWPSEMVELERWWS